MTLSGPSAHQGPAIAIRGLVKVYHKRRQRVAAVDGLDLEVRRSETFGLLGPNGAGKTTTLEICEGLLEQTAGEVRILGTTWRDRGSLDLRRRVGVALQDTRFFERQTVREVLTLFAALYDGAGRSVDECLELLALHEKSASATRFLSGGQRQRLVVACALVGRPELLFLDEPTTGLDPQSRRQLWDVVRAFRREGGTVLLTTHYMEEAAQLCDRVGVIDHGKLIALGSPSELVASLGAGHIVEVLAPGAEQALAGPALAALPSVRDHRVTAEQVTLTVDAPHLAIPPLLDELRRTGLSLEGLTTRPATLEDVFVRLTGRHLRDNG